MIQSLRARFESQASESEAQIMTKYMKNHFEFYGVRAPQVKEILKENQALMPQTMHDLEQIIQSCWSCPQREFQYVGMYIMDKSRNLWNQTCHNHHVENLFEFMISHKSWWDTVDFISSSLIFHWWKSSPDLLDFEIMPKWNVQDNMWMNRTSIIYQLKRRHQTNTQILTSHILKHSNSKEFFLQKAIGWALREYAKTDSQWVLKFVAQYDLKPLSKREALKQIKAGRIKKHW